MDDLDLMIDRVKGLRSPAAPLYVTAARVFFEFVDEMSDETFLAFEHTYEVVRKVEGTPSFPPGALSPQAEGFLASNPGVLAAYFGFVALAAEQLMAEELGT